MPFDTIVNFSHGLGDAAHFRLVCELYKKRGFDIGVHSPPNKSLIFGPFYTEQNGLDLGWWQEDARITTRNEWQANNKVMRAVNLCPLPRIEATIEELSSLPVTIDFGNARQALTKRPYISIHPQGGPGCYWGGKSLNSEQIKSLVGLLLELTDLDIVLLEWHNAYPIFSSPRVLLEKRPPLSRLANIVGHSVLHIDVDSGPQYLSRLTGTSVLGIVPNPFHHPVIFTLPRPRATYVSVPTPLSSLFPDQYDVVESPSPIAMEIVVRTALKIIGSGHA